MKINSKKGKTNYLNQKGITLIALVITIVVLLILVGVSINVLFSENGIIARAKNAQDKMDQATQNELDTIDELNDWVDSKTKENSSEEDNETVVEISTLAGKSAVTKNTKAEDAYGNKITIPKGFKVLAHGENATTGDVTYSYGENNIPAVQDGIVIEDTQEGTAGNQFVWVPIGKIKNKSNDPKGATSTITLGRYENFTATNGVYTPAQSAEDYRKEITISTYHIELAMSREGDPSGDSTDNTTARNLAEFISTSLANGGYYIARFEASGTESKIYSKYNQTVLNDLNQPKAATAARNMYGDTTEYASDLVNSYAWDTAIIFIQTYGKDASTYASENKSISFENTGINPDKYCNIWDMSGNAQEWTTEYSNHINRDYYVVVMSGVQRGGIYSVPRKKSVDCTLTRYHSTASSSSSALRSLLYVK